MKKRTETMDGNTAAAYISYAFTEVAGIYPITPSSQMAELVDEWAANGKQNLFGRVVDVVEMQSEGGAAGTVHGSLQAGALTTTYTASQGLLLKIPNMYKIAGELLPGVFHVSARTISAHGLSIFGDHSDVMSCRMTGFALLAASSPQEVMDMGAVAHLAAIKGRVPVLHFFDGFRTSHELQKIEVLEYEDLKPHIDMDSLKAFRKNSLNPEHPCTRGTTVNPDIFFQTKEAGSEYFEAMPAIIEEYMNEINKLTGRNYKLFDYYGAQDAEHIVIAMCSVTETIKETVDYLNSKGKKVGMINVHLYRPFSIEHFLKAIPNSVKKIAVLDRTKEPGSLGEPLYQDVCTAYFRKNIPMTIVGGRYGLASKDTTPAQIIAVYENLEKDVPKNNFTIGIEDDLNMSSLPIAEEPDIAPESLTSCKIWGLGADGTVGANKNSITIIGAKTDMYSQAYFVFDSKKSSGLTQSHLRFGNEPIRSPYLVSSADFVAVHAPSYVDKYDLVKDLKPGGTFLLNCEWSDEELEQHLPASMRRALAEKNAQFYVIDAISVAKELGLGGRTNTVLQAAFFKLGNIIPIEIAVKEMKDAIYNTYYLKGQEIVEMNYSAVDRGLDSFRKIEIPAHWASLETKDTEALSPDLPDFIKDVVIPINRQEGDKIPVSVFKKHHLHDGTWHAGTTQYEKRGIAVDVPMWQKENCIQCNQCAYVCPHAAIRPILLDKSEKENAPQNFDSVQAKGKDLEKYEYRIQVSPYDCYGCNCCVDICPPAKKALVMKPLNSQLSESSNWDYGVNKVSIKRDACNDKSVKASQFAKPYFEFSSACAGCGETPYIKLITQLFGDRMYIANASGCSTAYSGSTPATPYTKDDRGRGPAWAMSLFEDNAEYGFGFLLGHDAIQKQLVDKIELLIQNGVATKACEDYLQYKDDFNRSEEVSDVLLDALSKVTSKENKDTIEFIFDNKEFLKKKSFWAIGGDGWAYDIGFGGLDHVLAADRNINVLVMDTEVYSNTGGQQSKATPTSAVAKFIASGKRVKKKDLGRMAMSYGYIYVAQIAMGADQAQTLKAIREAEAYPGPSLVIAYSPCIQHGIQLDNGLSQSQMKRAVDAGYWHLYRYNPLLKDEGKNPFVLDSKEPTSDLKDFMRSENRFASLEISFPDNAKFLFEKAISDAKERYVAYKKLADD